MRSTVVKFLIILTVIFSANQSVGTVLAADLPETPVSSTVKAPPAVAAAAKPSSTPGSSLSAAPGGLAAAIKKAEQMPLVAPTVPSAPSRSPAEIARANETAEREQALAKRLEENFAKERQPRRKTVVVPVRSAATATAVERPPVAGPTATPALKFRPDHWDYAGDSGPQNWSRINPEWARCGSGNRQSPIDLHDTIRVDLEAIRFDYKPAHFSVQDDGHMIVANLGAGNSITLMGRRYDLVQMQFHRPAEHTINGKGFAMVAHLLHRDVDGKVVIVAVLLSEGDTHSVVQTVLNNLPLEKNLPATPVTLIDLAQLLPAQREYFTYMGSLTAPPCSEGVLWLVLKQPVQIAPSQIAIFARLYPPNARSVQPDNARMVKESN